jgi:hypothetical protein
MTLLEVDHPLPSPISLGPWGPDPTRLDPTSWRVGDGGPVKLNLSKLHIESSVFSTIPRERSKLRIIGPFDSTRQVGIDADLRFEFNCHVK